MAIAIDNVFFPDRLATKASTVRRRLTFVKTTETGFEPFRRAVFPHSIREWTIQSIPAHVVRDEGLETDVEKVYGMWECAKAQLYNFYFRPPYNKTVRSGQGTIVGGLYYQIYETKSPTGTVIRQELKQVFPDTDVVVAGSSWTGSYYVAGRFAMDEFEDEADGEQMTLVLPTIKIVEVLLG
jgi:hypothetical protein